jgi:hypothetical protein
MSASHFPAVRATALHAATVLARYERHVRKLASTWLDMELYRTVSEEIDEIQRDCALLPDVAAPWAALLVSHADLVHALWRSTQPAAPAGPAADVRPHLAHHLACIDALARRCLRAMERSGPPREALRG